MVIKASARLPEVAEICDFLDVRGLSLLRYHFFSVVIASSAAGQVGVINAFAREFAAASFRPQGKARNEKAGQQFEIATPPSGYTVSKFQRCILLRCQPGIDTESVA